MFSRSEAADCSIKVPGWCVKWCKLIWSYQLWRIGQCSWRERSRCAVIMTAVLMKSVFISFPLLKRSNSCTCQNHAYIKTFELCCDNLLHMRHVFHVCVRACSRRSMDFLTVVWLLSTPNSNRHVLSMPCTRQTLTWERDFSKLTISMAARYSLKTGRISLQD